MKKKILIAVVVFIFGFILYTYFTSVEESYYTDYKSDLVLVPVDGSVPTRETLPQAWDDSTRKAFWYTSQGSEIMPYDWFTWLEQSDNSKLFRNTEFMESIGYLPHETSELNPSGLPIGFAITRARKNTKRGMGFTCAACHTNQLDYKGKSILIEGAPTLANFVMFFSEIVKSLISTHKDDAKFERFAKRVLKENYSISTATDLRKQVESAAITTAERQAVNALPDYFPKDFTSYARLDAFGNITNAGSAFGLHDLSNKNPPTGPVSYPFLWGTHQSDVVQWNASAPNTPVIGPLVRNIGEVVGVFGNLHIDPAPWWQQLFGIDVTYSSTVDFRGLGELESYIMDLRSPAWPENHFPALDTEKIARGALIYAKQCKSCHEVIPRNKEGNLYIANKTLLSKLGTDPITAWNIQNHKAKTLILEGTKEDILIGDNFGTEATAINIPVNGVVGIVLKSPIKAIEAGLIPARHAGVSTDISTLNELLTGHLEERKKMADDKKDDKDEYKVPKALGPTAPPMDLDKLVYKGRPLNGIWATAPYLHNGSIPNLWELLTLPANRSKVFHVGNKEFDVNNVGYITNEGPSVFKVLKEDGTIMPGNSNLGHSYGTHLTDIDKWDLIEYIKSL